MWLTRLLIWRKTKAILIAAWVRPCDPALCFCSSPSPSVFNQCIQAMPNKPCRRFYSNGQTNCFARSHDVPRRETSLSAGSHRRDMHDAVMQSCDVLNWFQCVKRGTTASLFCIQHNRDTFEPVGKWNLAAVTKQHALYKLLHMSTTSNALYALKRKDFHTAVTPFMRFVRFYSVFFFFFTVLTVTLGTRVFCSLDFACHLIPVLLSCFAVDVVGKASPDFHPVSRWHEWELKN